MLLGILLWAPEARESPSDYEGAPHVWLEVAGQPLDNVHVSFPNRWLQYTTFRHTNWLETPSL